MPHPCPTPPLPSPPQPPPSPPQPHTLVTQGVHCATQIFKTHVHTVLHHTCTTYIQRILTQRLRTHLQQLPHAQLIDSSPHDLLLKNPLEVKESDLEEAYGLAARVGNKWGEVLKREGYCELAESIFGIVKEGNFLENSLASKADSTTVENEDAKNVDKKTASNNILPYTTINSLRRYEPDCDGSGQPSEYLSVHDCACTSKNNDSNNTTTNDKKAHPEMSSTRKVIQQLDQMARNGETMWYYGWDAICEAVKRNKKRLYHNLSGCDWEEEYEIVPKNSLSLLNDNEEDNVVEIDAGDCESSEGNGTTPKTQSPNRKRGRSQDNKSVHFGPGTNSGAVCESSPTEAVDNEFLISTNSKAARVLLRGNRRRYDLKSHDLNEDKEIEEFHEVGRAPLTIGEERWTWDDVLSCMTMEERQKLIVSAIHPPYPFESNVNNKSNLYVKMEDVEYGAKHEIDEGKPSGDADQKSAASPNNDNNNPCVEEDLAHTAVICGALKKIGSIHLWEQTRHFPSNELDDSETENEREQVVQRNQGGGPEQIYGAAETQAEFQAQHLLRQQTKALRKAGKERIGCRVPILSEHKAEYHGGSGSGSKTKWTKGNLQVSCESGHRRQVNQHQQWLEMDIGECMLEIVDDRDDVNSGDDCNSKLQKKRLLAFRSLEVALMDQI